MKYFIQIVLFLFISFNLFSQSEEIDSTFVNGVGWVKHNAPFAKDETSFKNKISYIFGFDSISNLSTVEVKSYDLLHKLTALIDTTSKVNDAPLKIKVINSGATHSAGKSINMRSYHLDKKSVAHEIGHTETESIKGVYDVNGVLKVTNEHRTIEEGNADSFSFLHLQLVGENVTSIAGRNFSTLRTKPSIYTNSYHSKSKYITSFYYSLIKRTAVKKYVVNSSFVSYDKKSKDFENHIQYRYLKFNKPLATEVVFKAYVLLLKKMEEKYEDITNDVYFMLLRECFIELYGVGSVQYDTFDFYCKQHELFR